MVLVTIPVLWRKLRHAEDQDVLVMSQYVAHAWHLLGAGTEVLSAHVSNTEDQLSKRAAESEVSTLVGCCNKVGILS